MFCRKASFLAGLTLCVSFECLAQIVTSAQNGYWHDPSTWLGGVVPSSVNCSLVRIAHPVQVTAQALAPSIEIGSTLSVEPSGQLDVVPPTGGGGITIVEAGELLVDGTLVGRDEVSYLASPGKIQFRDGSRFHYVGASRGFIPVATWHSNSTFLINGFAGSGYIAIAYSDSWKQEFGNVVYDCPLQTSFVDLNGYLSRIQGDLIIRNTNNQSLRLSTSQRPLIRIGGDFRVEGPSEVWMSTTSDSARIHVAGDFEYASTSTGPSYFTTRGRCYFDVGGAFQVDAAGPLRVCSGSPDSTGVRRTSFVIHNGLSVRRGGFIAPFPGEGKLIFSGVQAQEVNTVPGSFSGNLSIYVETEATVDLKQSEIVTLGQLYVRGHLKSGSSASDGALQQNGTGNFQSAGAMAFYPGATLEYNGPAPQFVGVSSPSHALVNVVINNGAGVTLLGDMSAANLTVAAGTLDLNAYAVILDGDLAAVPGSYLQNGDVILAGTEDCTVSAGGSIVRDLVLEKISGSAIDISGPITVSRSVLIRNNHVTLRSHGNLILASAGDEPGATAAVGVIPQGSAIDGDVLVQRLMSGEGRLYRYIASPVEAATVASLQDDFPVTGVFLDPSTGPGLHSATPSLYYYSSGWKPFPAGGYAAENRLIPGVGYAAFVRGNTTPVMLDFFGRLNQGSFNLPVYNNESEDPVHAGWSLVGNPYASAIDWGNPEGWTRSSEMGLVFAIRDNGEERFRYSDGEVGDANEGLIAGGQAFWVYAGSSDAELAVHENAKTGRDASFFRKTSQADFIRIQLEGAGGRDVTHVRSKAGARAEADPADAVKRWNDRLNLAVMSRDSILLAFSAVDTIPCDASYSLHMSYPPGDDAKPRPVPPGDYTLATEAYGLFRWSELKIVDSFRDDTVDARAYSFSVNDEPGSFAPDRFKLLVRSARPPKANFDLEPLACSDSVAIVRMIDTGAPAHYLAVTFGNEYLFDASGKVEIPLQKNNSEGFPVSIVARTICEYVYMGEVFIVPVSEPDAPEVISSPRCGAGTIGLTVENPTADTSWLWCDDAGLRNCVHLSQPFFETPFLEKSKTYFVVTENESGCRSEVTHVNAVIEPPDPPHLREEGGVLFSSVARTEWYRDDQLLHTGSSFRPSRPGTYTARELLSGCAWESSIVYQPSVGLQVFPVPFSERVEIIGRTRIDWVEVFDIAGNRILQTDIGSDIYRVDTSIWTSGVYIFKIHQSTGVSVRRVIKQ